MQKSYVVLFRELETLDRQEAEHVADYQFKRQQIVTDLQAALASPGVTIPALAPLNGTHAHGSNGNGTHAPGSNGNGTPMAKTRKKKSTENGSTSGPTTKQHILNILRRSRTGLDLRGIVAEMTRMKESGEWQTETESVTGVVSTSINGLKKDKYVRVEKNNETNRNVYTALPQTATAG